MMKQEAERRRAAEIGILVYSKLEPPRERLYLPPCVPSTNKPTNPRNRRIRGHVVAAALFHKLMV